MAIERTVCPVRWTLRHLLLQSVASAALLCLSKAPTRADCVISGDTVTCSGNTAGGLAIPPPNAPSVTVNVSGSFNGGITISGIPDSFITNTGSINGDIIATGGINFTFSQNGTFGATAINAVNSGINSVYVAPGLSVTNVTMSGQDNLIDNAGTVNGSVSLTATGQNRIVNRLGGAFNAIVLSAPVNTVENEGVFNSGLQFTADGVNTINNRATGIINGILATGNSIEHVRNDGSINGTISLGAGADWYVSVGGSEFGNIDLGPGNDTFYLQGGLITSPVDLGTGNDTAVILNGTLSANFVAGPGTDSLYW